MNDEERQAVHDAYMRLSGATCEQACGLITVLLDRSETATADFKRALADWAVDFETRTRPQRETP